MIQFERGETRILSLADGETLVVRSRLTNGEQRAMLARIYTTGPDGTLQVNPWQNQIGVVTAYLLDWSGRDAEGRPVRIADRSIAELEQVLDSLTPDSFGEILAAIERHVLEMRAARDAEKKTRTGVLVS
jgi:hypothetical protein